VSRQPPSRRRPERRGPGVVHQPWARRARPTAASAHLIEVRRIQAPGVPDLREPPASAVCPGDGLAVGAGRAAKPRSRWCGSRCPTAAVIVSGSGPDPTGVGGEASPGSRRRCARPAWTRWDASKQVARRVTSRGDRPLRSCSMSTASECAVVRRRCRQAVLPRTGSRPRARYDRPAASPAGATAEDRSGRREGLLEARPTSRAGASSGSGGDVGLDRGLGWPRPRRRRRAPADGTPPLSPAAAWRRIDRDLPRHQLPRERRLGPEGPVVDHGLGGVEVHRGREAVAGRGTAVPPSTAAISKNAGSAASRDPTVISPVPASVAHPSWLDSMPLRSRPSSAPEAATSPARTCPYMYFLAAASASTSPFARSSAFIAG
jgi:hypothetical protein